MNIPHCFVSLRYDCTLLLEEGGREGRGRYGNNSRTGVAVSEEMKEGQSGSGEHGAREGGKGRRVGDREREEEGRERGREGGRKGAGK